MSCRYQKHAVQQDERSQNLEQELKAARPEITELKAVIGSSNIVKQAEVNDWIKPKNSKAVGPRFSAHNPPQLQLRNRFTVLETDTLEIVQQSPGLLKQKDRGVNKSVGNLERKKEKKDSIAWKKSWKGNGTNASRKPGLQIRGL
jgi:hypothetical protein